MNAAKAVARINPKIHRFERGARAYGTLTEGDILLALSMISSNGARLLARVMYAGQPEYGRELYMTFVLEANMVAGHMGWDDIAKKEVNQVCAAALREYMRPRLCRDCRGNEHIPNPTNPAHQIECPTCGGQGGRAWSERERARASGMGRTHWRSTWEERYTNHILPILDKYHDIFWQGLFRRLK